jgi:branched-chain amino acid transport system permease protein
MHGKIVRKPSAAGSGLRARHGLMPLVVAIYLAATLLVARADLNLQSLVLLAAVFGMLALSLDLVAGMLGLYSLGQSGFAAIGAYLTTLAATNLEMNVFVLLPIVVIVTGLLGLVIGAASLRVSGLYFAITTFIFTLVVTVLATNLQITNGNQGLLGPTFPDFPEALELLGSAGAWCAMLALLVTALIVWNIRNSPLYPVLLAIRDAEPFAEAAGVRTGPIKIGMFGLSAAIAGVAGWVFCFLGVISPSQFDWSVSLNILVMVLLGGINSMLGPLVGAAFVSAFPVVVSINPWLQEIIYGALSIFAITVFPEGFVGLARSGVARLSGEAAAPARPAPGTTGVIGDAVAAAPASRTTRVALDAVPGGVERVGAAGNIAIECRGIQFSYEAGSRVLNDVDLLVKSGEIHGLIGPNGSGKSTLANVIAGRLRPDAGMVRLRQARVDGHGPAGRARLGLRRTFQAAELVRELTTRQNVLVGAYTLVPGIPGKAPFWSLLPSSQKEMRQMEARADDALSSVGAEAWAGRRVGDVPHGIEQLTQLATVCVADPEIIILDEPATGLSAREVDHLASILAELKARGVTMIIIEHQTRFLFPLCDRVTVLNAGEVILTGTAEEVRADPVVRKVYLGE